MGHGLLMFGVLILVGWCMFVFWLVALVFRTIGRVIGSILRGFGILPPRGFSSSRTQFCTRIRCGAPNPAEARFCRRCGTQLLPGSLNHPNRFAA